MTTSSPLTVLPEYHDEEQTQPRTHIDTVVAQDQCLQPQVTSQQLPKGKSGEETRITLQKNRPCKPIPLPSTDPALIEANRKGILTPEQTEALVRRKHLGRIGLGYMLLILSFIFFCFFLTLLALLGEFFGLLFFFLFIISTGWALIQLGLGYAARNRYRRRLAMGQIVLSVERQEGEIIWDQKQQNYRADFPGSVCDPLYGFLPGPYVFYVVRAEGQVVSLEPLQTLEHKQKALQGLQQALCQTLGFDLSDLDANRQGQITQRQRPLLPFRKLPVQFLEGEIIGEVETISNEDGSTTNYYYHIQGIRFNVSNEALGALIPQVYYRVYYLDRVYYLKGTRKLLSAEPLEVPEEGLN